MKIETTAGTLAAALSAAELALDDKVEYRGAQHGAHCR